MLKSVVVAMPINCIISDVVMLGNIKLINPFNIDIKIISYFVRMCQENWREVAKVKLTKIEQKKLPSTETLEWLQLMAEEKGINKEFVIRIWNIVDEICNLINVTLAKGVYLIFNIDPNSKNRRESKMKVEDIRVKANIKVNVEKKTVNQLMELRELLDTLSTKIDLLLEDYESN